MALEISTTTRAYTLKLAGDGDWRELLWKTHVVVNRGAQAWGDWLLTLRGGLPASLADDHPEFRVILALSWLSVESPASLVPQAHIVARGTDLPADRQQAVIARFQALLTRFEVPDTQEWIETCEQALKARIRDDAVWVDRAACFAELQRRFPGLDSLWATETLFDFLGGAEDYFAVPDPDAAPSNEAKDFVQKAGGWLSRNWGTGEKSDSTEIARSLTLLTDLDAEPLLGRSGRDVLAVLARALGRSPSDDDTAATLFKLVKQAIGWKGRPSKGAMALGRVRDADCVSSDLWQRTVDKFREEAGDQAAKGQHGTQRPAWMEVWRREMESLLGMPYRVDKDRIWEHGVTLDHALRRVSSAHTWIKRAEAARRRFREDAAKIEDVPPSARLWLDDFRDTRLSETGALGDYLIRKRAIDGWDKVVIAWAALGANSTRKQRIDAAREVQANLDDNEKFGDIQLFAGFGDDDAEVPQSCLADETARCVWQDQNGSPTASILRNYVAATGAEHDQRRFKVPAYRHPDPLRHPVYVDFGNSRWGIAYSALKASRDRTGLTQKLLKANSEQTRAMLRTQLDTVPDLRGVSLDVWNGACVESLALRWHSKRFWKDLGLDHFADGQPAATVSRGDRLGRIVAGQSGTAPINVAEVFQQTVWNGRLQVPREQLDRLADIVYGKRADPDLGKLQQLESDNRVRQSWQRLDWFLTTSAKLRPQGPWLDYVAAGLTEGIKYKKGRNGYYLDYTANQGRKGRARLKLARLAGLRVLSLDLGHRYAAACAVWETISAAQMIENCRAAGHSEPSDDDLYVHLRCATDAIQKSGKRKGLPVTSTTVYRRIGPDVLPDGSLHPAPWAKLERQFLIKLQGEDRPARYARADELQPVNAFRGFLGMPPYTESLRVDELQRETLRVAQIGLRRLGDIARIAYAITAQRKSIAGGREIVLTRDQRVKYLEQALGLWQELAGSTRFRDEWADGMWRRWVVDTFDGPQPAGTADAARRAERRKQIEATRGPLRMVAERLIDSHSADATELQRQWTEEYRRREQQWRKHLRCLRRLILPRRKDCQQDRASVRGVGGLSVTRLKTTRDLYRLLKAFHMRPEPDDLRKNVPATGDDSLAAFGRRILKQLERLREQRIKQLASRIVEAALGAGRTKKHHRYERKRPQRALDRPCHVIVAEDLERYKPEDSRLRRENRQLMDWAARNVRKYLVESCELHGLHFVEVGPAYTSRQDSRTGAPGVRCEDVSIRVLQEAARRVGTPDSIQAAREPSKADTGFERKVRRWVGEICRVKNTSGELTPRDRLFALVLDKLGDCAASRSAIRLPRRGGELFVSATGSHSGLQADLNAAANIGLRAVTDPDWMGAWWFVLVNLATGKPTREKIQGCPVWESNRTIWPPAADLESTSRRAEPHAKRPRTDVYAWNPLFMALSTANAWLPTTAYWGEVERKVAEGLGQRQIDEENPF